MSTMTPRPQSRERLQNDPNHGSLMAPVRLVREPRPAKQPRQNAHNPARLCAQGWRS